MIKRSYEIVSHRLIDQYSGPEVPYLTITQGRVKVAKELKNKPAGGTKFRMFWRMKISTQCNYMLVC